MIETLNARLVTGPVKEPVTMEEARDHLRHTETDDLALVASLLNAARTWVENHTGRALITQTWSLKLDAFPVPRVIELPRPPLQSVSSVVYTDTDGVSQTWSTDEYDVDTQRIPGRIVPGFGEDWPSVKDEINSVTATYVAGYGADPADVPEDIRHAIKLMVAHFYAFREPVISGTIVANVPLAVHSLLEEYRQWRFL